MPITQQSPTFLSAGNNRRATGTAPPEDDTISSVRGIAPWVVSLIFHLAAMAAMFAVVFPLSSDTQNSEKWSRASIAGDPDAPATSLVVPGLSARSDSGVNLGSPLEAETDSARTEEALRQLAGGDKSRSKGGDEELNPGSRGIGNAGPGLPAIGIGGGGSGEPGEFGLGGGGGSSGPEFFGVGGTTLGVRSVVYVVDRSASMIGTFSAVTEELKRSIMSLRRSQKFHVIFFAGEMLENPPARLVNAVDAHKRQFFDFLDTIEPKGSTKPERAVHAAMALEPDVLYFLSDGVFDPSLLKKLDEWNKSRKTRIFTIAYLDQAGQELLQQIAHEHNGEFKYVTEDDLP